MPEVIDAEKLYEKEIARLQGEVGNLTDEQQKLQHRNALLKDENTRLEGLIQKHKDEIISLGEKQKKAEEDFNQSRSNSIAALDKRDKESSDRLDKADKREAELHVLSQSISTAKGQLLSIAEDQIKTIEKIVSGAKSFCDSVKPELEAFLVLKDSAAPIPSKDQAKKKG